MEEGEFGGGEEKLLCCHGLACGHGDVPVGEGTRDGAGCGLDLLTSRLKFFGVWEVELSPR